MNWVGNYQVAVMVPKKMEPESNWVGNYQVQDLAATVNSLHFWAAAATARNGAAEQLRAPF